ncbi:ArsR/SmtB family transcription factor [Lacrimispora indolis]|uniref:ArsR/SmtB family transcription factor n=1 Tax=Lacrimispora indolis TaxID=69825 RepID=UPI0003F7227E|nr:MULTISPECIES: ArsR family transcriptional regulator [Lachnospiraceae]MBE7721104.1 ArsR family transcriptional regulator [Lacrimispora celerecrescens]
MKKQKAPVKIIGERDIELNLSNLAHHSHIISIGKALSSPVRLNILNLLKTTPLSIQEIASILSIPVSSTAAHIKCLEEARMVVTETQPGNHGSMRVCICSIQTFTLETFDSDLDVVDNTIVVDMPIGNYFQCQVEPTCGLADENGAIDTYDSPTSFYSPYRMKAQLLWFQQGFIEYRFQNLINPLLDLHEISFSMELCSEAPGYLEDWPSDITISVNGHEITTFCSPGDFGARRGRLTPAAWSNGRTQYGLLKTFSVREDGGYLDRRLINPDLHIGDLELEKYPYISLIIAIKKDARYIGGINLFGEKYGDYPQGIIMNLIY